MRDLGKDPAPGSPEPGGGGEQTIPVSDVLREDAARHRALVEHARDAIVEISTEAVFLYVNPGFTELFGYSAAEVVGRSALEWVHPEDLPKVDAIRAQAFAAERSADLVFRFRRRDGAWRWLELVGRPYRAAGGELRGVLVARDATARVQAECALQEQLDAERHLADLSRRFLNVTSDGFADCVRHGLQVAARLAGADRGQVYLMETGLPGVGGYFRWASPGVAEPESHDVEEGTRLYPWMAEQLIGGQVVHVPRVRDLPAEAASERAGLLRQGVLSYLALPIAHEGRSVGFIDFFRTRVEKGWSEAEITRLRLLNEVLGGAVRRLHAECRRREAEERFRTLTYHAQDTICEMALDGRVLYISDNFERLCGIPREELGDQDPWSFVHPQDAKQVRRGAVLAAANDGGEPLLFRIRHRTDGWRWLEASVRPFGTASGEKRLALVIRDVTERHQQRLDLERQLEVERRVAEFSRTLLESGAEGIDAAIQSGLAAAAQLAGADRAYLVSSLGTGDPVPTSYDWHAPDVPPRDPHALSRKKQAWTVRRLLRGEVVRVPRVAELPQEARHVRASLLASGVRSFLAIPIHSGKELLGVVGFHCMREERHWSDREIMLLRVVVDLFASALHRKRAELGLEQSQIRLLQAQKMEAVGTLAGGIAHDFNNQLTVMLSNARFALREAQACDEVSQALEDLTRAAEHCAQLTRSLLAFSRRSPGSPFSLEVGAIVEEAEELLRPLIPSSIRFTVSARDGDARITGDPTQLQQVLVNLVVNARDAMPDGGQLFLEVGIRHVASDEAARLGLAAPGNHVEFAVRDTGVGMDAEVQARIFEPFFTTKPVGQGTGLGLATAYGIVEQCGGVIAVESQPRRGATFRVLLPLSQGEDVARSVEEPRPPAPGAGTVLLVEDEPRVRRLLARMLRESGYEVIEAPDGAEALRLGRQQLDRVAAVVTDVDMPRLGGAELARRLARARPELPVLFISGLSQASLDETGAAAPHARFLSKPFTERALLENLQELLAASQG